MLRYKLRSSVSQQVTEETIQFNARRNMIHLCSHFAKIPRDLNTILFIYFCAAARRGTSLEELRPLRNFDLFLPQKLQSESSPTMLFIGSFHQ